MNAHARTFEARPAVRDSVPLLVGLMGPSGSGKTFSALRLATGIQSIIGGDIYGIDTEARRMLHYADNFTFQHVEFNAPFGSLDYLAALRYCVGRGARVIVVDSFSHEHESTGGMLDYHDRELDRLAGDDWAKRERVKMLAWQKPKAARRALITGLLQLNANFIFCFRAKETAKPVRVDGKTEIVNQGFMPIAGDDFLFEQTVNCLLYPKSNGVPTWQSAEVGERLMMKLPRQFEHLFADSKPLDEATGRALAQWAAGTNLPSRNGETPAPSPETSLQADGAGDDEMRLAFIASVRRHIDAATDAQALGAWWKSDEQKRARRDFELTEFQVADLVAYVTARHNTLTADAAKGQQQ